MAELHEASFKWPAGPSKVIVTGSFDNWAHSTELEKGVDGFTGTFHLPWDAKILYKYVVDGEWRVNPKEPQEPDEAGNINNVYTSPPKPASSAVAEEPKPSVPYVAAKEPEVAVPVVPEGYKVEEPSKKVAETVPSAPATEKTSMEGAKDTAASVVSYMASGLGAAFASVTGIDPINPQQIPLEDDKAKKVLETIPVPKPDATKAEPAPTIATAHDPLIPEAPITAKPISDALAPIADEPVVLNLLPAAYTATKETEAAKGVDSGFPSAAPAGAEEEKKVAPTTSAFATATSYIPSTAQISAAVSGVVTAVTDKLPSTAAVVDKVPEPVKEAVETAKETVVPATSIPVPDAPEPYKEAPTTDPIPVPDAPEPYKETNGTLPGEVEAAPKKVEEAVEKAKDAVPDKATEAAEKVKDTVASATNTVKGTVKSTTEKVKSTPPSSPTKKAFPSSSDGGKTGSVTSSAADGTPKRKKRMSIFGKLKEALHSDKKKKEKVGSTSS